MSQESTSNENAATVTNEEAKEGGSSWSWSSLLQTAKQKSAEAYEFMKRDLTEFKDTVQNDTLAAVNTTADYVRHTISTFSLEDEAEGEKSPEPSKEEGVSANESESPAHQKSLLSLEVIEDKAKNLLFAALDVITGQNTRCDETEAFVVIGNRTVTIPVERWKSILSAVQMDSQTYCHEPEGPPEDYEAFLTTFNLIDHESEIQEVLKTVPEVSDYYSKFVPTSITHNEFWHRYYYRIHQLVLLEEMKEQFKEKTPEIAEGPENVDITKFNEKLDEEKKRGGEESSDSKDPSDMVVVRQKYDGTTSPSNSDATKVSDGSEDWEKTELSEIVDETTKKITEKLKACTEKLASEEYSDWEFQ